MTTRRRTMLGLLPAALWLASGRSLSQSRRPPFRIAWVGQGSLAHGKPIFVQGMIERGYVRGRDFVMEEPRVAEDRSNLTQIAEELVRNRTDLVVTSGPVARGMFAGLRNRIPMVFGFSGDPIVAGLVKAIARPGGSATGVSMLALELVGKRIELLREVVPGLKRVGILANPSHPGERSEYQEAAKAAARLGIDVLHRPVHKPADVTDALIYVSRERVDAIDLFPDGLIVQESARIAEWSRRERKPTISGWKVFARQGNVLSYGPNVELAYRQVAAQVDRVLKGAKIADLPVEFPTHVELVVNMRAARALDLTIPPSVLVRANEVIE